MALTAGALAGGVLAHAASARSAAARAALYLVQFDAAPLSTYTGGVRGIDATRGRLDRVSRQYTAYRDHLRAERARTLRAAGLGEAKTVAEYDVVLNGALVGCSLGLTAEEPFTATAAGRYEVYVVQYATAEGVSEQDMGLNAFVAAPSSPGNLTVTPAYVAVTPGRQVELTATWFGLGTRTRYLGVVEYGDGSAPRGTPLVSVAT